MEATDPSRPVRRGARATGSTHPAGGWIWTRARSGCTGSAPGAFARPMLDDWPSLSRLSQRFVSEARQQGNVGMLHMALFDRGLVELVSGNIRDAEVNLLEHAAIGEARLRTTSLGRPADRSVAR
jgi:hypothetical protein